MVTITCPNPGSGGQPHTGWSLSPGGGDSGLPLDTSPSKYTLTSSNSLTISNINGTDEGLYRCVYGPRNSGSERNVCIYVYGEFIQQQNSPIMLLCFLLALYEVGLFLPHAHLVPWPAVLVILHHCQFITEV